MERLLIMVWDKLKDTSCLLVLPLIIFLIFVGSFSPLFDSFELDMLDFRFRFRPPIPVTDKLVIIQIDDYSIEELGQFPLDRSYHALLIKALKDSGAKAVVFDIFFSEPNEGDVDLAQRMMEAGNVYIPFVFDMEETADDPVPHAEGYTARNLEDFRLVSKGRGHINIIPDSDGKFRRVPLYIEYKGKNYPYLSFLVTCDYLGISLKDIKFVPGRFIQCGPDIRIPLDDRSNIIINYSGRWGHFFKHYAYADVLRSYVARLSGEQPVLDLAAFKDKICVIGLSAAGTADLHPNPLEPLYPSVGIHGEIFNSIINKNFVRPVPPWINALILFVVLLSVVGVVFKNRPLNGFLILLGMMASFVLLCFFVFILWGIWLDLFYPVLAMALIYMFCRLRRSITEWKRRIILEKELQIAKQIQESFLPSSCPQMAGLDVTAMMMTAREVGGDLYDFVEFDKEHIGVMIGDVSGKGVPASLFMSMVTGAFRFFSVLETTPEETLHRLNQKLVKESKSHLFVTLFYSVFDMKKGRMTYANGGHLPVLRVSQNKEPQMYDVEDGLPLGIMDGDYSGNEIGFERGDIFVFYTDGVTEAVNKRNEMYETERLIQVVERHKHDSAEGILYAIEKDVRKFEPPQKQHDDITFIVVKINN